MPSSIPTRRESGRKQVRSHSLRALAVAARMERQHGHAAPPGDRRTETPHERRAADAV
ncbi:hypothetical protein [Actinomadura rayongensis]|uniref:Uncharacterized protein n=1 Tax=Actinomadura rayongensis TaxID=1429076 RepID=A0A6I4WC62_9ACTN|nr:hypothetical protein [Actinomadura rayongensis]MXQ64332.1 hypothetical protein [Actinomadura rayongensis]